MSVVGLGRVVGNLLSKSVLAIAVPFHPFGGAIDVIVVEQRDGAFRSTPWHIQFGKFQGVLKGAEKVRITVNGVEADFHMYLDRSGEAYFVSEVDSTEGSDGVDVVDCSVLGDETNMLYSKRNEMAVSDGGRRICFEDEQSSLDDSVEVSNERKNLVENNGNEDVLESCIQEDLRDETNTLYSKRNEMAESDVNQRICFEEEQSSLDDSVEMSNERSNHIKNNGNADVLESCIQEDRRDETNSLYSKRNAMAESDGEGIICCEDEQCPDDRSNHINIEIVNSHDRKSEVIFGGVDGHVPAYFSTSKKVTEKVQLAPPQNRPGLGDRMSSGEGNEKFDAGEDPRPCNCNNLNASKSDVDLHNVCSANNVTDDFEYQLEVCEGDDEHVFHSQNRVDVTSRGDMDRVSNSCMELTERGRLDSEDVTSFLVADNSETKSIEKSPRLDETVEEHVVSFINNELHQPRGCDSSSTCLFPELPVPGIPAEKLTNSASVYFDFEAIEEIDREDGGLETSGLDNECAEHELMKFRAENSNERTDGLQTTKFEISLCGSKLYSGMGLSVAAEAFDAHRVSAKVFGSSAASITRNENLVIRFRGRYWHWDKVAPIVLGMAAFGMELPMDPKDSIPVEQDDSTRPENKESENVSTPSGNRWRLWPIPFRRVKKFELDGDDNEEVFLDTESEFHSPTVTSQHDNNSSCQRSTRTNVPTTEQIASLNLREGQNRIEFAFSTKVLGVQKVDAHIYLWKWNARIVISDVDGTITKSDVLGQFMPLVGMDWSQSGVARLFSAIKENGYQLLFLSARAIVQAYLTRSFLLNLKQDGEALPDGPVVISPDGLFPSLYREVIRRTPHEFKIACLEEIRRLFPSDHNPFYAGFGNRDTDELSYIKMGIPKGKIFIINPKGEVMNSHSKNAKSYTSLLTLVNEIFPPASSVEQEDFNEWNYWKMPLPEVD